MNYYDYLLETPVRYDTKNNQYIIEQENTEVTIPARMNLSNTAMKNMTDYPQEFTNSSISGIMAQKLNKEFEEYAGEKNPQLSVYTKTLLFLYTLWKLPMHLVDEWSKKLGSPMIGNIINMMGYTILKFGPAQLLLGLTPKGIMGFIKGLFSFAFQCIPERLWFLIKTVFSIAIAPIKGVARILGLINKPGVQQESVSYLSEAEKQTGILKRSLIFMLEKILRIFEIISNIISRTIAPIVSCINKSFGKYGSAGLRGLFMTMKDVTVGTGSIGIFLFSYVKLISILLVYGGLISLVAVLGGGASQLMQIYKSI